MRKTHSMFYAYLQCSVASVLPRGMGLSPDLFFFLPPWARTFTLGKHLALRNPPNMGKFSRNTVGKPGPRIRPKIWNTTRDGQNRSDSGFWPRSRNPHVSSGVSSGNLAKINNTFGVKHSKRSKKHKKGTSSNCMCYTATRLNHNHIRVEHIWGNCSFWPTLATMAVATGDCAKPLVPFVVGPEDEDMGIGNVSACRRFLWNSMFGCYMFVGSTWKSNLFC